MIYFYYSVYIIGQSDFYSSDARFFSNTLMSDFRPTTQIALTISVVFLPNARLVGAAFALRSTVATARTRRCSWVSLTFFNLKDNVHNTNIKSAMNTQIVSVLDSPNHVISVWISATLSNETTSFNPVTSRIICGVFCKLENFWQFSPTNLRISLLRMTQNLWETLLSRGQNLAIRTSQRTKSKMEALTLYLHFTLFPGFFLPPLASAVAAIFIFSRELQCTNRDTFIVLQLNQSDKALLSGFPVLFSFVVMRNRDELWGRECKEWHNIFNTTGF